MKTPLLLLCFVPVLVFGQMIKLADFPHEIEYFSKYDGHLFLYNGPQLYRFSDSDEKWEGIQTRRDSYKSCAEIGKFIIHDSLMFSYARLGELFRSTDKGINKTKVVWGQNWEKRGPNIFHAEDNALYYHYGNDLWTGDFNDRSFRKMNSAEDIVIANHVQSYTFYISRADEHLLLVRSKDQFVNADSIIIDHIALDAPLSAAVFDEKIVLSCHADKVIYVSEDAGTSWTIVPVDLSPLPVGEGRDVETRGKYIFTGSNDDAWVNEFLVDEDSLFIATNHGIYKFTKPDLTKWESVLLPDIGYVDNQPMVRSIIKHHDQLFVQLDNTLVFRRKNGQWKEMIAGIDGNRGFELISDGDLLYLRSSTTKLFKSSDGGATFTNANTKALCGLRRPVDKWISYITFGDATLTYDVPASVSTDEGNTWNSLEGIGSFIQLTAYRDTLWGVSDTKLYYTLDGEKWNLQQDFSYVLQHLEDGRKCKGQLAGFYKRGSKITVFANRHDGTSSYSRIYQSQDSGAHFAVSSEKSCSRFSGNKDRILIESLVPRPATFSLSLDAGTTWKDISYPCEDCNIVNLEATDKFLVGIAATGELYYSVDEGNTWSQYYKDYWEKERISVQGLVQHQGKWLTVAYGKGLVELTHFPFSSIR